MKKVMVIGGSGFTGQHLLKSLSIGGLEIFAIQNKSPLPANPEIRVIKGGIRAIDHKLIDEIKPDLVFHFARPKFPMLRKAGRIMAARYAAVQNRNLIREMEKADHPVSLIFASGSLMYGSSPVPPDEDSPLHPVSFARQYYPGEMPVLNALKQGRIPVMVIRFPWLLGDGSWFEWFYVKPMKKAHCVPIYNKGDNLMEIIDIKDAIKMTIKIAESKGLGVFNVVSAGPVTQFEFASDISRLSGLPVCDYRKVFEGKLEKEVLEAFSTNIPLKTKHADIFKDHLYIPLDETLMEILKPSGLV